PPTGDAEALVRKPQAAREPAWHYSASLGAFAFPVLEIGWAPGAVVLVLEAFFPDEGTDVDEVSVLVALQQNALAARHFRHAFQREDQQLAILAGHGHLIAFDEGHRGCLDSRLHVE